MRTFTLVERSFVSVLGITMLWFGLDGFAGEVAQWQAGAEGAGMVLTASACMLLMAPLFLFVGIRGRGPRWMDRFKLPDVHD